MQPFLAESAPRPGRAIAFVAALAVVASIAMAMAMPPRHHRSWHHEHHQLPRLGKCVQGYMYLTR